MEEQEKCVVGQLVLLRSQFAAINELKDIHNDRIGCLECLHILKYHFNISEIERKISAMHRLFVEKEIFNMPLLRTVSKDGIKYAISIARMDKVVTGEFESIEDLLAKLNPEEAISLSGNLDILEERLLLNSMLVYDSLITSAKLSAFGKKFRGLIVSKKRKYLYHYVPDKKHVLGFVASRK